MTIQTDRRRAPRVAVPPMYAHLYARRLEETDFIREGHAYDVSLGGLRFDLHPPVEPGTQLAIALTLPGMHTSTTGPDGIFAFAEVVWVDDELEPGPVRTAARWVRFARAIDQQRLERFLDRHPPVVGDRRAA